MHPVEKYLGAIAEIFSTGGGTAEESYYGALETLLNEVGAKLKPRVRAVAQLQNTGAGEPDFGLYTANQFQRATDAHPLKGAPPERGVVEVKGWSDDSFVTASGDQVSKYGKRYGLVLVTNYRDFALVRQDEHGKIVPLETCRLADSEAAFHAVLAHPHQAAADQGDRLIEFLRRVLLYEAALTDPEDLAWFLASYAREARFRIEAAADLPALDAVKQGLQDALGMVFEGEKGDRFFRATLIQTLFYGIFSSWVLWSRDNWGRNDAHFDWHQAAWTLHVPMVAGLFDQIATRQRLKPLGIDEVLDWAGAALNRVDRAAFFSRFEEEHAVQYFYEPFLKAYDPMLRKELGVWYTPPEIVQYQVERVDRVVREELGLADGLADENVVILDPCCGTGAYLVETLNRIHRTLKEQGDSALMAQKLKKAAMERVFGFDILPAPFVVAHLQIGLMLRRLGAPLDHDSDQRAGVFLTNALTGWDPPRKPKDELPLFPELMEERDAANKIKSESPILVVLGNPPYNAYAGLSPAEEGGLVEVYKEGLTTPANQGGWGIKKFNLDDLYVRFIRIAERRITKTGKGVVCFISNYSWTTEPSFVVLRKRLLWSFDKFWIENMHGNRNISEYAPDGRTSETIFSIPGFSPGIRQGVVISLWVRRGNHEGRKDKPGQVVYRDDIDAARASARRRDLLASLDQRPFDRKYRIAKPDESNRYSFRPSKITGKYRSWPPVSELAALPPFNGPVERRGNSLIVMPDDRRRLEDLKHYLDPARSDDEIRRKSPAFMKSSGEFDAIKARKSLKASVAYNETKIASYPFKPFDVRMAYLDASLQPLFSRPSPQLLKQRFPNNVFFLTRDTADKDPEGPPFYLSSLVCDYDFISGHTRHFPLMLMNGERLGRTHHRTLIDIIDEQVSPSGTVANLSDRARDYLKALRISDPDSDLKTAGLVWMHALAIGYSSSFLDENKDGIRLDWPRVPLPAVKKTLLRSAELGRRVAALLDVDQPAEGVSRGKLDPRLKTLGVIRKVGGGALDPEAGDLDLTVGWGHRGKGGVCQPGKGKLEVRIQKDNKLKVSFGDETLDVYLNGSAFWSDVPRPVWDYTIGGYQVIKKWLSYREKSILGRGLTLQEADYVTEMVRRLAALVLMQSELNSNYEAVKQDTWPWPAS